ncbi:hypothetical protein ACMGE7_02125 [Macrococcus equi]|uniref:hypothetical protein n=1 Tax=Macrococcus equi TaxID=3395462 RepID=UPI0039BE63D0
MIAWYIKNNKKYFMAYIAALIIFFLCMCFIFLPKFPLFAMYLFIMMLSLTYVDTISQIKRYLENNNAKQWLVAKWHYKDCVTFSIFVLLMLGLGYIAIQNSPPNLPAMSSLYTFAIIFVVTSIFKWLRYMEYKREMKEGNIV